MMRNQVSYNRHFALTCIDLILVERARPSRTSRTGSRTSSRASSQAPSQVPSEAPSRAPSRSQNRSIPSGSLEASKAAESGIFPSCSCRWFLFLFLAAEPEDDSDENNVSSKKASRNPNAKPKTLPFYPRGVRNLILAAKKVVYHHLVIEDAFPKRNDSCFSIALQKTILSFAEKGLVVEPGKT